MSNHKIAIYTCITNGYDELSIPRIINPEIDYICFNDGSINVPQPWVNILINEDGMSPKDSNRFLKLLPHKSPILSKYDLTIYIDGSIEIQSDLNLLIEKVSASHHHTFIYKHSLRDCVYDECKECYFSNKISLTSCRKMVQFLKQQGVPQKLGLFECTILIRKNKTENCIRLMELWWGSYLNSFGVKRDQIALMYTLWKFNLDVSSLGLPDYHFDHEYFKAKTIHSKNVFNILYNWWIRRSFLLFLHKARLLKID